MRKKGTPDKGKNTGLKTTAPKAPQTAKTEQKRPAKKPFDKKGKPTVLRAKRAPNKSMADDLELYLKSGSKYIPVRIKTHTDKNDGHPHVIIENLEDKHVSIGLSTQKKKGKGKKSGTNFALEKSPLDDGKNSYMRRQGTVASKEEYKDPRDGSMTPNDFEQAKIYAERAKQKYLKKKEDKKK
jgi:hypothetical protein